jgi:hypothetical protein
MPGFCETPAKSEPVNCDDLPIPVLEKMTREILERWFISMESYERMSDARREELEAQMLDCEVMRLMEVQKLKCLVGERWKDFVDAKEHPNAEGRKLLDRAQPHASLAPKAEKLQTAAAAAKVGKISGALFDGVSAR